MSALPRVVWLLVDGLSFKLLEAFTAAQPDSRLGELARNKSIAALRPLAPNCQTPPSLFALWSATAPDRNGMTGYDIPVLNDEDPLGFADGFRHWPRDIPMVWDEYARRGLTVRTCAIPFMQPERLGSALLSATDVFGAQIIAPRVLGDGDRWQVPGCAYRIRAGSDGMSLIDPEGVVGWVPCNTTVGIPLRAGEDTTAGATHRAMAVHAARIDGEPKLVSLGYNPIFVHGRHAMQRCALSPERPYVVANPGKMYAAGQLGRRREDGGDGGAEMLLMDLLRELHLSFSRDVKWAVATRDADLVVAYYPVIDLLSHQLLRQAAAVSASEPALPDPIFHRTLQWLDQLITEIQTAIGPDTKFIIQSDHGMAPIWNEIHPNRFFLEQGWLRRKGDGSIDAGRSLVFLHPAENGLLVCHRDRLRAAGFGLPQIIERLSAALSPAQLSGIGTVSGPPAWPGSDWQVDTYLQMPAGTRLRASMDQPLVTASRKGGDHTVASDDPWLRGIFVDASDEPTGLAERGLLDLVEIVPGLCGFER